MVCLSVNQSRKNQSLIEEWKAEQEGKPTWRMAIRLDIRNRYRVFILVTIPEKRWKSGLYMETEQEYISFKSSGEWSGMSVCVLSKTIPRKYVGVLQPKVKTEVYQKAVQIHPKKKLTGIQALYYSYLPISNGVLPKRPKKSPYAG